MPVEMSDEELEETTGVAMDFIEDESDREVVINRENRKRKSEETMSDADLVFLRRKFPFLAELSDKFVRSQTTTEILKMESTALKIKMMEQTGDIEDKLACNKSSTSLWVAMTWQQSEWVGLSHHVDGVSFTTQEAVKTV